MRYFKFLLKNIDKLLAGLVEEEIKSRFFKRKMIKDIFFHTN
jgi:hypothetical protein